MLMRQPWPFLALVLFLLPQPALAAAPAEVPCDVYYFGIGQRRDPARAFACEMALPEGNRDWVLLTIMHMNGEGTPRDVKKAREAFRHERLDYCGVTCGVLDQVLRRHEARPDKKHPRVDYCKQIAQTTLAINYCLGVEQRLAEIRRKREERAMSAGLAPEVRKRFTALSRAFATFKEADGIREYQNFKDGTIRGEASDIMEKRVSRHHDAALAAFGPNASQRPPLGRPLAEADQELNRVYREIMAARDADIAEAQATASGDDGQTRVEDVKDVRVATRDAERAWLRYVDAWKKLVTSLHPDDAEAPDQVRAFLTEQRIRQLKYSSIGESGTTDPEEDGEGV